MLGTSWDDPKTLAALAAAQQLLSGTGSSIQRLADAGMSYGGILERQKTVETERQRRAAETLLMQQRLQQLVAQQKAEQEAADRSAKDDGLMTRLLGMPVESPMPAGVEGPGVPMQNSGVDPRTFLAQGGSLSSLPKVNALNEMTSAPARPKPILVGTTLLDPETYRPLYSEPKEPPKPPSAVQEYEYAVSQGYKGSFQQFEMDRRRAGATNVQVSTGDRIPPTLVKEQDALIDRITTAQSIETDLGAIEQQIKSGQLKFGPVRNLANTARNVAGMSTEESRAYATFLSSLEKLRNDSLRLNTGVQTEGDAQRAWNELFQNINDTDFVAKRLAEIRNINRRAAQLQMFRLNTLRANSGASPLQMPSIEPAIGGGAQGTWSDVPRVTSVEEYNALPSGSTYIDPQGNTRKKP